jgi:hypothetical protein
LDHLKQGKALGGSILNAYKTKVKRNEGQHFAGIPRTKILPKPPMFTQLQEHFEKKIQKKNELFCL